MGKLNHLPGLREFLLTPATMLRRETVQVFRPEPFFALRVFHKFNDGRQDGTGG
jgi:hypothetical protein